MSKKNWLYQAPAIGWALLIFYFSSLPSLTPPSLGLQMEDKILHAAVFAVLGYLVARAFFFQKTFPVFRKKYLWISIVLGVLYGISDEYHQSFVPNRFPEIGDAIADSVGAFLGVIIFRYRSSLRKRLSFLR